MAWASTVAVVVPSPATSEVLEATSRTIWAPMFSRGSLSSISLATVTPSLVMTGEPNFLSRTTLRPLGPRVTFTASARRLMPRRIDCRDSSPYVICFAMSLNSLSGLRLNGQHLVLAHDEDFVAVDLQVRAGVLAEQDPVPRLDVRGDLPSVGQGRAGAHGEDLAALRLLLGRIRDDDPAPGRHLLFQPSDEQTVVKRTHFRHRGSPFHGDQRASGGIRAAWEGVSRARSQYPLPLTHAA